MFFILVHVTFLAADACLSWSLPSITEQQVCPHRLLSRCMQYWLKNHWPNQALFKHSLHTNCISNSAILCNILHFNFIAKWFVYMHTLEEKRNCKGSYSSLVSSLNHLVRLQTRKQWAGALLSAKCCCFFANTIVKESHKFELACLKKKKKKNKMHYGHLANFLFGTFVMPFSATGCVVHHENTRR